MTSTQPAAASPRTAPYAQVILERSQSNLDKELTYEVPDALGEALRIGSAVLVPVGHQTLTGYVTGFSSDLEFDAGRLRPIRQLASKAPLFDAKALQVARWISAYYHCSLGDALTCFVPHGWQQAAERRYALAQGAPATLLDDLARSPRQRAVAELLGGATNPLSQKEIEKALGAGAARSVADALKRLQEQGHVTAQEGLLDPTMKPRRVQAVNLTPQALEAAEGTVEALARTAPKQAEALRKLLDWKDGAPLAAPVSTAYLAREFGIDSALLRGLEKKELVQFTTIEITRSPVAHLPPRDSGRVVLTDEQQHAVTRINELLTLRNGGDTTQAATALLQGVTASGKTEVYLSAIEHCLSLGRRALVLVPEIALTAQTVDIFHRRFQERVAILHSALGSGERFDEWRRIRAGRADIVVGARSAVFAPCRNLGLIIIDEEHDHSYKQDSTPRYHARDVAARRASLENAVLVLGSATPSLESYHRAQRGEYAHLLMQRRIGNSRLPAVDLVDMTSEARMGAMPVLGAALREALCAAVARGEQVILFLNRRGYSTYIQCMACGHVAHCPNCDVSLTFHRGAESLRCHHCGHEEPAPEACPQCAGWMLRFTGTGTEKVELEVNELLQKRGLEQVKTLRLDRDTTMHKGSHGRILGEFRQGHAQILIGTQMVTKGLDFPRVTLVGVISADGSLNMPDFRAAERTFQLLSQVAGRAGRGDQPGRVIVQALATDHYAIEAACAHNFQMFVDLELGARQTPSYPPFAYLVNIISQDESQGHALARIQRLAVALEDAITAEGGATELLGPVDCPIARVKNKYRFHLMLRDRNRPRLHRVLAAYDRLSRNERDGFTIDVDPTTIL